jgi:hypothetical protein
MVQNITLAHNVQKSSAFPIPYKRAVSGFRFHTFGDSLQMGNSQSSQHMKVFSTDQLSLNPLRGYGRPGPRPNAGSLSS